MTTITSANTATTVEASTNSKLWKGNLVRLLADAKRIHGDKYDYSRLRAEQIVNSRSRLDLTCLNCNQPYMPTILDFIYGESDCRCHSKLVRWRGNLTRFLTEAKAIHGDNYDYTHITADQIQTVNSVLNLPCNNCGQIYKPTLNNFINQKTGCPCYSNMVSWKGNLDRFITEAKAIHGDNYDYSGLTASMIVSAHIPLEFPCNNCGKLYRVTIANFIYNKRDCPCYSNHIPWKGDLNRFLIEAKAIHGDKYNYDYITADQIITIRSRLNLPCNNCGRIYNPTISDFIHGKRDCPCYSDLVRWDGDLDRFLTEAKAKAIHGDKYDYSTITADQIQTARSELKLPCRNCGLIYITTIMGFIHTKSDCYCYSDLVRWKGDLDRFLTEAKAIHGDRYDYTYVTADQILNAYSIIELPCNQCGAIYTTTINGFINGQHGCWCYCDAFPWRRDLDRFLAEARAIHGDHFDYSHITADHIETSLSVLELPCNYCKNLHITTISRFIYRKQGCSTCSKSQGERLLLETLTEIGASMIKSGYRHPNALQYPYDVWFQYQGKFTKIEYDGEQHFKSIPFFDRYDSLENRQLRDRIKSIIACNDQERFIRIDYTFDTKEKIKNFLLNVLNSNERFVLSTPEMYLPWIYEPVTPEQLQQYVPTWYQKLQLST